MSFFNNINVCSVLLAVSFVGATKPAIAGDGPINFEQIGLWSRPLSDIEDSHARRAVQRWVLRFKPEYAEEITDRLDHSQIRALDMSAGRIGALSFPITSKTVFPAAYLSRAKSAQTYGDLCNKAKKATAVTDIYCSMNEGFSGASVSSADHNALHEIFLASMLVHEQRHIRQYEGGARDPYLWSAYWGIPKAFFRAKGFAAVVSHLLFYQLPTGGTSSMETEAYTDQLEFLANAKIWALKKQIAAKKAHALKEQIRWESFADHIHDFQLLFENGAEQF